MLKVPLSLYVHIPWCVKKCPYCDFNSHEVRSAFPQERYTDALITDLRKQAEVAHGREIISVFIGGGTPSLFSATSIRRLLAAVEEYLTLARHAEITIEANPGTSDQQNFAGFRDAGVNRISIGAQSFSNAQLRRLGRIHDAAAIHNAVTTAKNSGFGNINIDLMYALPEQSRRQAGEDLEQAMALHPTHISYYQLTIEANTRFHQHPPALPGSEAAWDMQQQGAELLAEHGFRQYEVSAYAKDDFACLHNLNYWRFGDYIGIGAGAHQKISCRQENTVSRCEKPRHPQQYMRHTFDDAPLETTRYLAQEELVFEFLMNTLRLTHGFERQQFERYTGLPFARLRSQLKPLQDDGLLIMGHAGARCSDMGYRFLDELLQRLLPARA